MALQCLEWSVKNTVTRILCGGVIMETRSDKKVKETNQAVNLHVGYDFSSLHHSWSRGGTAQR